MTNRITTSKYFKYKKLKISNKNFIDNLELAFQTWEELNKNKDNVILICYGYTNHHFALDKNIGWFNNLMGPGKAIDTDKYFTICSNMLGSSFGSTGPKSIHKKTNNPYGSNFPKITNLDIINTIKLLLVSFEIKKITCTIRLFIWGTLSLPLGFRVP
ncbi:MAG: hypothetical protein ACJ0BR_02865 [Candidatus Puniceispirillales bacterium]